MRSLSQKSFSIAVLRLLADRHPLAPASSRTSPKIETGRRDPSATALRRELESFRRAQGAAYWHHEYHAN